MLRILRVDQKAVTIFNFKKLNFLGRNYDEESDHRINSNLSSGICVNAIFAANGNKGDWGFDPKYYRYALIEGEITAVDHDKRTLNVKGNR